MIRVHCSDPLGRQVSITHAQEYIHTRYSSTGAFGGILLHVLPTLKNCESDACPTHRCMMATKTLFILEIAFYFVCLPNPICGVGKKTLHTAKIMIKSKGRGEGTNSFCESWVSKKV